MQKFFAANVALLSVAFLPLLTVGCAQSGLRVRSVPKAPAIAGEQGQAHIRGVSDPNAPFTLVGRREAVAQNLSGADDSNSAVCSVADLQVYEAAASMEGDARVVRLAFKNRGTAVCRLSGYPEIKLQDAGGSAIGSIAIRQTDDLSLRGSIAGPAEKPASGQAVAVVLRPGGEANFDIGWTSGDTCPLVSRITVSAPGLAVHEPGSWTAGSFAINHPLNVCGGEVRVTPLAAAGIV